MIRKLRIFFVITLLLVVDIAVYLILGVALMRYDDFYEGPSQDYFTLKTMDTTDKVIYITFNLWGILNLIIGLYLLFKLYKYLRIKITNK